MHAPWPPPLATPDLSTDEFSAGPTAPSAETQHPRQLGCVLPSCVELLPVYEGVLPHPQEHIIPDMDVVFVEYSINDPPEAVMSDRCAD